jgi:hypothetical protein
MVLSSIALRRAGIAAAASVALGIVAVPGAAQMRAQIADKIATNAGHQLVAKISNESCSEFASTMAQMKGSKSSSGGGVSTKLKSNPQARTDFVNIVAGPLLNKMIDCDMMPGGM